MDTFTMSIFTIELLALDYHSSKTNSQVNSVHGFADAIAALFNILKRLNLPYLRYVYYRQHVVALGHFPLSFYYSYL